VDHALLLILVQCSDVNLQQLLEIKLWLFIHSYYICKSCNNVKFVVRVCVCVRYLNIISFK